MGVFEKFFGFSVFKPITAHTRKVHACVELLRPITQALLNEQYEELEQLHNLMSKTEYEADRIKDEFRATISKVYLLSIGKNELKQFIRMQDHIADSAEDFAVVALLRKTRIPDELKEDFLAFVDQVIRVSEHLLNVAEELALVAEAAFVGEEAERVLETIDRIGYEEWQADRLQRKFARHAYSIEAQLDPVTLMFIDKYCRTLSAVANDAERAAKYLRDIIK